MLARYVLSSCVRPSVCHTQNIPERSVVRSREPFKF